MSSSHHSAGPHHTGSGAQAQSDVILTAQERAEQYDAYAKHTPHHYHDLVEVPEHMYEDHLSRLAHTMFQEILACVTTHLENRPGDRLVDDVTQMAEALFYIHIDEVRGLMHKEIQDFINDAIKQPNDEHARVQKAKAEAHAFARPGHSLDWWAPSIAQFCPHWLSRRFCLPSGVATPYPQDHQSCKDAEAVVAYLKAKRVIHGNMMMYKACKEFGIYRIWMSTPDKRLETIEVQLPPHSTQSLMPQHGTGNTAHQGEHASANQQLRIKSLQRREVIYKGLPSGLDLQDPTLDTSHDLRRVERDVVLDMKRFREHLPAAASTEQIVNLTETAKTWRIRVESLRSQADDHKRKQARYFREHAAENPHHYHSAHPLLKDGQRKRLAWVVWQELESYVSEITITTKKSEEQMALYKGLYLVYADTELPSDHDLLEQTMKKFHSVRHKEEERISSVMRNVQARNNDKLTDDKGLWVGGVIQYAPNWDAYRFQVTEQHKRTSGTVVHSDEDIEMANFVQRLGHNPPSPAGLLMYKVCKKLRIHRGLLYDQHYRVSIHEFQLAPGSRRPGLATMGPPQYTKSDYMNVRSRVNQEELDPSNPHPETDYAAYRVLRDVVLDLHHAVRSFIPVKHAHDETNKPTFASFNAFAERLHSALSGVRATAHELHSTHHPMPMSRL